MNIPSDVIPESLRVTDIKRGDGGAIAISTRTFSTAARCPWCNQLSSRVHSRYHRTLSDLPWAGRLVCFQITVRKFYCANHRCSRKVFAERLEGVAKAYSRCTNREREALEAIAFALGGEAGARLATRLGLPISPDTLLRYIRAAPEPPFLSPRVLGVDDWAWKKRYRYGTILVDLERRRVLDLLQDSASGSFAHWLDRHPTVEVISRDRGGEYAEGARRGASSAVQVADRFHLVKNLAEVVEKVFRRYGSLLAAFPCPRLYPGCLHRHVRAGRRHASAPKKEGQSAGSWSIPWPSRG
jgi:transposase